MDATWSPEARQIRAEFQSMPGLSLSVAQAARLWGWTHDRTVVALSRLAEADYLVRDARGMYRIRRAQSCWGGAH
jgi:hypothetical protein